MKHFTSVLDIPSLGNWLEDAKALKKDPRGHLHLGKGKTLGLLFFNNSLRTRLSTQKAAINLGMDVMVMNFGKEGWALEFADGTVMNGQSAEHIREAARVVSQYCDILGIRAFAQLENRELDESEPVLNGFLQHATIPVVNLESALGHPLQALADAITLEENRIKKQPRVVLTWAPHPRALPHAVANSFVQIMQRMPVDLSIVQPSGYELDKSIIGNTPVYFDQAKALQGADFVYAKNWSSFEQYGQVVSEDQDWMVTKEKLGDAKFMHCLPVRRNVVVEDAVLESEQSLVIQQANNRTYSAQLVLKKLLEGLTL
ncbi:N-acetylornithine carbamoyltransferase [Lentiprolixibacter aurantiacus]|uniref:N-succinylornithine carbamoyltransferase n=1 Tax=Lentiprolixibacter aurantiacus TaxID=2993939 RepID=A0AAE3MIG8_9FLAO|nr:N-acetylornithine carbamoyltransferase [Lentiprolixibacter aurantiacus]MCX2718151.1 N-acetylornithine carbamoyltransferase [Lentiprolixibacter aurantiacus]